MHTISVQQLGEDPAAVIAAAQASDVLIVENGKVMAVVTRPRGKDDFASYWQRREALLKDVVAGPRWDSTEIVSEDRDRA